MLKKLFCLRSEDVLNIAFAFAMLVLTLWKRERISYWYVHALVETAVISTSIIIPCWAYKKDLKGLWFHLANWYVVLVVPIMFMNLKGFIEAVNPVNWDLFLIQMDKWLFLGHEPSLLIEKIYNPVLTEILQFAYISYFFIPIILGISAYKKDLLLFRRIATVVLLTFYLSYLGYFLVPAIGPRFTLKGLFTKQLKGLFFTPYIKSILNTLEPNPHDCFPSGHTAVSLVCLMLAGKYRIKFWLLLPMVVGLIISTVYHRYHYVVDVIAGIILAVFSYYTGQWFFEAWERKRLQKIR
ncbi:MAG: phosphatase PAP2 family protein [Deferribacteres bacterium]|nr:phosphatase PAP2 family protein [Deferribacteres bacterium]